MATSSALSVEPFPLRARLMIKWRVGRRPDPPDPPAVQKLRRRRSTSPAFERGFAFGDLAAPKTWPLQSRSPYRRRASSGALGTPLLRVDEISSSGELGALPLPLAGEGWGGGILARILMHAPTLSLQPKSDVSDFGHLTERPNSNKSEFGCKRGRGRQHRLRSPRTAPTASAVLGSAR
jgi:hypothetical protein